MDPRGHHRNTRQRDVILEELNKSMSHPTATELYERARQRLPKLSLGTVYRNLEVLSQMGFVRKLEFAGGETRFDGNLRPHHHVRCVRCGRVDDAYGLEDEPVARIKDLDGFEVIGYHLDLFGVCPDCTEQSAPEKH